jgi:sugar diacid utilization regulator
VRELVESPTLKSSLVYVLCPETDPAVTGVALIEDVNDLRRVEEHAIVLLTRGASASAASYRFDVAMRMARSARAAALVVSGNAFGPISPTSARTAARWGIAILASEEDADLAKLAIAISRELFGGADVALLRAHAAVRAVAAHPADGKRDALVQRVGAALGIPLAMAEDEPPDHPRAAIVVDDHVEAWLTAPPQEGDLALGLEIGLHVTAAATSEALTTARRAEEIPIQSRAEVLSELLSAQAQNRSPLARQARQLGVPIDGWHVAVRLELEDLSGAQTDEDLSAHETRTTVGRAVLQGLRGTGGSWHTARIGPALLLLRMYPEDPGVAAAGEVAKAVDRVLSGVRARLPATLMRCGVGSAHQGPSGLVSSVAEAKAAVTAARTSGRVNVAVPFDSVGLRRTLVEWYASETAREAVTTVLAPLDELGGARAERLIQTLHVYLDNRGSLIRTAETLNLHRNAVGYRINKIFSLLDVDPHNADDLLLLQLACRARELG